MECFRNTFLTTSEGKHSALVLLFLHVKYVLRADKFHRHCCSCLKYVNTKSWNIFKANLQSSKVKHIRPYLGCQWRFSSRF